MRHYLLPSTPRTTHDTTHRIPGFFTAHKDHQSLTLLVALSDPHDFAGGGGAAWSHALPLGWQWPSSPPLASAPLGLGPLGLWPQGMCAQLLPSCDRASRIQGRQFHRLRPPRHRLLGTRLARPSRRGASNRAATTRRHRAALRRPRHARWHACDGGRTRGLRGFVQLARRRSGPGGGGRAEPGYLW